MGRSPGNSSISPEWTRAKSNGSGATTMVRSAALWIAARASRSRGVISYTVRSGKLPCRSLRVAAINPSLANRFNAPYNAPTFTSVHSSVRSL